MKTYIPAARRKATAIKEVTAVLTDEQALIVPSIFSSWEPDASYETGDRVRHNDTLFRCLLAHTSQATWAPGAAPSLWARMDDPGIEWPDWIQPDSTNPYKLGAKVTHKGKRWVSTHPANVWEPGVYGWEEQP